MSKLAKCPCGKTPTDLLIEAEHEKAKYAMASGNCCAEWRVEFMNNYFPIGTPESNQRAVDAWNLAPRGKN